MASLYLKAKTGAIASLSPLRCDYFQIQTKNDSNYSEGSLFTVLALAMERFISVRKWECFEKKKKLQGWWDWSWLQLVVFKLLHNNIILADQMAGILFFKALKSKKDSYIRILRPQTSISRCASLTGLACIVALAILTNVTSLFEYKTKVQVNFLRFIVLGTPQLFPPKKVKVWHNIYYRRTWLSKGRVLFGERFLFQQTKVQERPLGDISWSCPHTCAWTPFISRLQINYFLLIY